MSRLAARSCALGDVRGLPSVDGVGKYPAGADGAGAQEARDRGPGLEVARRGWGAALAGWGREHEVYRPDVVGWRRERLPELPEKTPILVRPDWFCEVLSPSNTRNDLVKKQRTYQRCQVPHHWIVDPMNEVLTVHRWMQDGYLNVLTAERGERVRAEPFGAIEWSVGVLFGDDPDEA
ncbi:Uma2 family endonuclease [Sorangium sp. So ce233]|uniref:Uma2 family endonuclease n=1 Tax=Sorangium sp. So ce233 TaxID=3133290 RepID=UPI003F603A71